MNLFTCMGKSFHPWCLSPLFRGFTHTAICIRRCISPFLLRWPRYVQWPKVTGPFQSVVYSDPPLLYYIHFFVFFRLAFLWNCFPTPEPPTTTLISRRTLVVACSSSVKYLEVPHSASCSPFCYNLLMCSIARSPRCSNNCFANLGANNRMRTAYWAEIYAHKVFFVYS
jgi:hypothetical protein